MSCEETFFKMLRERGFRLTPQREMVLSVMHQLDEFTTAEEIFNQVSQMSSAVDISTVYRTLEPARPLIDSLKERLGFQAELDCLSIPGLCQDCSAARSGAEIVGG